MSVKASDFRRAGKAYQRDRQYWAGRREIEAAEDAYEATRGHDDATRKAARDRLYTLDPRNVRFTD